MEPDDDNRQPPDRLAEMAHLFGLLFLLFVAGGLVVAAGAVFVSLTHANITWVVVPPAVLLCLEVVLWTVRMRS